MSRDEELEIAYGGAELALAVVLWVAVLLPALALAALTRAVRPGSLLPRTAVVLAPRIGRREDKTGG